MTRKIFVLIRNASNDDRRCTSASLSRCLSRCPRRRVPEYLMAALADLVDLVARLEQRLRILLIDRGQRRLQRVLKRSRELVPAAGLFANHRPTWAGPSLMPRAQGPAPRGAAAR